MPTNRFLNEKIHPRDEEPFVIKNVFLQVTTPFL
jgi:hypothetical protein